MIRGIYTAAAGMMAESLKTDVTANNLANANTTGFKKDAAVTAEFGQMLLRRINDGDAAPTIGSLGTGVAVAETTASQAQGTIRHTGNTLDLALDGRGFFVVDSPNGLRYTRNGSFSMSPQGELVTADGYRVLGQAGPIRVNGGKLTVGSDGSVTVDGVNAGQLQLVDFADSRRLTKEGDALFLATPGAQVQPASGRVVQGALEAANVNVIREMVNLIGGYRAYEVNAKAVQAHDELLDKAVNEVGRV